MIIRGSGGGSKQPKQRTPVEAPDSIRSRAVLSILDLLGEGKIGGLVGGLADGGRSVFLDGTPLQNPDGSKNFEGFEWHFRDGTQNQAVIDGFEEVTTPFNMQQRVRASSPVTFSVDDSDADQVRIIMAMPALTQQNASTGDTNGTTVQYQFAISNNGGPFVPVNVSGTESPVVTISDKSRSKYQRAHLLDLPKPGSNYRIRITRLTADTTDAYTANETWLDSYFEIQNTKLNYPNSVLFGIKINAEQFQSLPQRSYLVNGLEIRIPANYNPETRVYTGIWDGTFKMGVTNNPAWILYDLLMDERYGLGRFISESQINKSKLYQIGRYCDGMVSNGYGGLEPRFTLNTCIMVEAEAYKVIQDVCSVFRGMSYWHAGAVQLTQDSPSDPIYLFNNANVVDGLFSKSGSARKDRHSVVHVQWNDPDDQYKKKIEYVEDPALIQTLGYRRYDTTAFGCTSRAEAHRIGRWILYTESSETDIISFTVGLDGLLVLPGDLVLIQDEYASGKRNSGRLKTSSRMGCTLDKPIEVSAGARIAIRLPDGKFEERPVNEVGLVSNLTFATQLSAKPVPDALWIMIERTLVPVTGRVVGVQQGTKPSEFVISCVQHNPSKYASIEEGMILEQLPTTILDPTYSTPENMRIDESTYLASAGTLSTRLDVSWEGKSATYFVTWRFSLNGETSGWKVDTTRLPSFEVPNALQNAIYEFKVVAQSVTGKLSNELVGSYTALGNLMPPSPPTDLVATGDFRSVILTWVNPTDVDFDHVRIYESETENFSDAKLLDRTPSTSYTRNGVEGLKKLWYWVSSVNKRGMESSLNSSIGTWAIAGQITETDLDRELAEKIEDITVIIDDIDKAIDDRVGGLRDRLDDAFLLAEAARSGNVIEQMLRDDEDTVIKNDVYELGVSVGEDIDARIKEVNTVAANDRESVAIRFGSVETRFGANEASFVEEVTARTTADQAFAQSLNSLTVKVDNNQAGIVSQLQVLVDADTALATELNGLRTRVGTNEAALVEETRLRTTADESMASTITTLTATVGTNKTEYLQQVQILVNADASLLTQINAVKATADKNSGLIATETTLRINADSSLAQQITSLKTQVDNDVVAAIQTEATARSNADGALSTRIDTVQATANGASSAVQTISSAQATTDGKLSAMWGVKLQTMSNGQLYAAGMGIGIENTSQGITQSQISFQADRFVVVNPLVPSSAQAPFEIVGGVVRIKTAVIGDGTITMAKIAGALQSDNYIAGQRGWRLTREGLIEINGVVAGQGRISISNQLIQVFDANSVLRVRMGIWA